MNQEDEFGCLKCFCYGHSAKCDSAPSYNKYVVESSFDAGNDGWKGEAQAYGGRSIDAQYDEFDNSIGLTEQQGPTYFIAPSMKIVGCILNGGKV